jgi:hypothetical protein
MAANDVEPFRGLPLTHEQDAEIRTYIAQRLARYEPWDTLGLICMLKDMLKPPSPVDDAVDDEGDN